MRIRVCRSKNAGVAGYAEAFRPVHSDLQTSEWYSYLRNDVLGGVRMATSSITHNFVISNPNSVKRFIAAIDEADRDRTPKQTLPGRQLTNPQEILALMSKRKKQTLEY